MPLDQRPLPPAVAPPSWAVTLAGEPGVLAACGERAHQLVLWSGQLELGAPEIHDERYGDCTWLWHGEAWSGDLRRPEVVDALLGETDGFGSDGFVTLDLVDFDLAVDNHRAEALRLLGVAIGDEADVALERLERRRHKWHEYIRPQDPLLIDLVVRAVDEDSGSYVERLLRVIARDAWLVAHWAPARFIGTLAKPVWTLLLPTLRVDDGDFAPPPTSGGEALERFFHAVLRHEGWQPARLERRLDTLERDLYAQAGADAGASVDLGRVLEGIGTVAQAAVELKKGPRELERRAGSGLFGSPDSELRITIETWLDGARADIAAIQERIRSTFVGVSSIAANLQTQAEKARADREKKFERRVTKFASLVLIPGLVFSFYSTQVRGLPGAHRYMGLVLMLIGAALGGLATLWALSRQEE